ncbi:hypothetical protein GQR58_002040 [Nymphon striatum]|nr:hypothetical protein GQR58_002040 [Nymphon striatum]
MMKSAEALKEFEKLVTSVKSSGSEELGTFFNLIQSMYLRAMCSGEQVAIAHDKLNNIASDLKELVPLEGIFSSESITKPLEKEIVPTYHVDAFIYDDEAVDKLVEEGKVPREYCTKCGCFDIKLVDYISHSLSRRQASFIFSSMIKEYLKGFTVLDIGSRLGCALYGAYFFGHSDKIIGIEMNKDLCNVQKKIIEKYQLGDRIQVIEGDVLEHKDIVQISDVIILNNVFEHFLEEDKQVEMWTFLHDNICKPGTLLVTSPKLEDSLNSLKIDIDVSKWVKNVFLDDPLAAMYVCDHPDLAELHLYKVL